MPEETKYKKPDWFTMHVVNPLIKGIHRLGFAVAGSQTLAVRGRKSGELRTNPVNPFELDGHTYLLSPRGTTQWVRNLRAAGGEGELRTGRKVRHFHAEEVPDAEKLPLMRLYMDKWAWEVKGFLGIDADASDEEIRRILPDHPVFVLTFSD
ncbi:MAG TPA: nitroreductase family deazaflavin-dependent oxidoreductase [Solirubrobacterales bacterium]|nr:nitroreductase family deazaflavin-dependent oxidoreductase [Solirubrobacterales bacterium]